MSVLSALFLLGPSCSGKTLAEVVPGDDCLECHSERELSRSLADGDVRSLYVDPEEWLQSPHAAAGCTGCHGEVDIERHPEEGPAAVSGERAADWSRKCRTCHGEEGEYTASHMALITLAAEPGCVRCHAPHRMKRVREWKPGVTVSAYCLICHRQQMRISLAGGATLSLTIREAALGASVHLDHQCTDCHGEFSKLEHPVRDIADSRKSELAANQVCRNCHEEHYKLFEGSLHFQMADYGHPGAPQCTDCHGYHAVAPVKSFELLSGLPCRRCHAEVFEAFAKGAHRPRPRVAAHMDLPVCVSCHRAHEPTFTPVRELVNETCLECHGDAYGMHQEWLSQASAHLEAVACIACHAPAARREFFVRIWDSEADRSVGLAAIRGVADPDLVLLLNGAEDGNKDLAFWGDLVLTLNKAEKAKKERYRIRLELEEGGSAHEIGQFQDAHRECEDCHEGDLQYLERVFLPQAW